METAPWSSSSRSDPPRGHDLGLYHRTSAEPQLIPAPIAIMATS